jgi:hypothetical protein
MTHHSGTLSGIGGYLAEAAETLVSALGPAVGSQLTGFATRTRRGKVFWHRGGRGVDSAVATS